MDEIIELAGRVRCWQVLTLALWAPTLWLLGMFSLHGVEVLQEHLVVGKLIAPMLITWNAAAFINLSLLLTARAIGTWTFLFGVISVGLSVLLLVVVVSTVGINSPHPQSRVEVTDNATMLAGLMLATTIPCWVTLAVRLLVRLGR